MFQPEEYEYLLHEIKNYICLISGSLHLITKHHPEVREYHHWNEILSDVEHISQMCREVSASNLHSGIRLQTVDPTEFFCSFGNEAAGLLGSNIQFSMDISSEIPEMVIDPVQIKHILINLIKNASEAIADNGIITLSASSKDDQLYIQVQDNGCGMCSDQLDKIFLPAYTTKSNGTGVGLFITKTILEAHDGNIICHSHCGKGTTFIITLPLYGTGKERPLF